MSITMLFVIICFPTTMEKGNYAPPFQARSMRSPTPLVRVRRRVDATRPTLGQSPPPPGGLPGPRFPPLRLVRHLPTEAKRRARLSLAGVRQPLTAADVGAPHQICPQPTLVLPSSATRTRHRGIPASEAIMRPYVQIAIVTLAIAGCATIVRGTTQQISINSQPIGAKVVVSNGQSCFTPCNLEVERKLSLQLNFSKEGCQTYTTAMVPTLAGAGAILGGIIDYGTGAVYDLQPNPLMVTLNCQGASFVGMPQTQAAGQPVVTRAAVPVIEPQAQANHGVLFASYETRDQADQGWSDIWGKHSQMLAGIQPTIEFGSFPGAQPQHHLYGRGLTKEQAESLCSSLRQRNEYCLVVKF